MSKTKTDATVAVRNVKKPADFRTAQRWLKNANERVLQLIFAVGCAAGRTGDQAMARALDALIKPEVGHVAENFLRLSREKVTEGALINDVIAKDIQELIASMSTDTCTVAANIAQTALQNSVKLQRKPEISMKNYEIAMSLFSRLVNVNVVPGYRTKIISTVIGIVDAADPSDIPRSYALASGASKGRGSDPIHGLVGVDSELGKILARCIVQSEGDAFGDYIAAWFERVQFGSSSGRVSVVPAAALRFLINTCLRIESNRGIIERVGQDGLADGLASRQPGETVSGRALSPPTYYVSQSSVFYSALLNAIERKSQAARISEAARVAGIDTPVPELKYKLVLDSAGNERVYVKDSQIVATIISHYVPFKRIPESEPSKLIVSQNLQAFFKDYMVQLKAVRKSTEASLRADGRYDAAAISARIAAINSLGPTQYAPSRYAEAAREIAEFTTFYKPRNIILLRPKEKTDQHKPSDAQTAIAVTITSGAILLSALCQLDSSSKRALLPF